MALAAVFDNLAAGRRYQRRRGEIPCGRNHFRVVAGIRYLFYMRPKAVGFYDTHIRCIAGNATVSAVGFHHKVGGQGRHLDRKRVGIETERSMVDVNGFVNRIGRRTDIKDSGLVITVAHCPRVVNIGVLLGFGAQYQIVTDTERIGCGCQSGGVNDTQGIEIAKYLFNDQTLVKAGNLELEAVFVGHRAGIGYRVALSFSAATYRISSHLCAVAVKDCRSERIPPCTGKDKLRHFAFANRRTDQFGIKRKFLLDVADIYRIVGVAVLRRLDIYIVGKEARIGAVENLVRTVRVAVSVPQAGGRRPGIGIGRLVSLIVGRIEDGQIMADADLECVGHLDVRQRMNGKFERVDSEAEAELIDHLGHQYAAFFGNETDGVVVFRSQGKRIGGRDKRPFGAVVTVGDTIGNRSSPYAEVEAVAIADFAVGAQIRIRQFEYNHHDTLKVGATVGIGAGYTVSGGLVGPYHNAAVANGSRIHIHRQRPFVGGGTAGGQTNRIATAYISRIGQLQEVARIGGMNRNRIRLGHQTFHTYIVALSHERYHIVGSKEIFMVVEAVAAVAEFERNAVYLPIVIGCVDRRREHT